MRGKCRKCGHDPSAKLSEEERRDMAAVKEMMNNWSLHGDYERILASLLVSPKCIRCGSVDVVAHLEDDKEDKASIRWLYIVLALLLVIMWI